MNETSPSNGNANQSSCVSNKNPESKVPIDGDQLAIETTNNITNKDDKKVPSCSEVLSNVSDVKLYESSISDSCNNEQNNKLKQNNHCDQAKMSPVEGPVNEMPKTMFDNKSHDKQSSDHSSDSGGCEQFSGQIVYNPDGSAYIMEENDDSLLEQIPKQEGSIVEKGGKCLSEVEYPKIDQAVYIERRKAWYSAMGSAYLQFLQGGKSPESPQVHNFRVVSVKEKITSKARRDEDSSEGKSKPTSEMSPLPVKPILMCFICKLSFTSAKTFLVHSTTEHGVSLSPGERELFMTVSGTSAILQCVGPDRAALMSILEPVREEPRLVARDLMVTSPRPSVVSESDNEQREAEAVTTNPFASFMSSMSQQQQPSSSLLSQLRGLPGLPGGLLSVMAAQSQSPGPASSAPATPTNASQLQGTTIGPCPDHVNGRQPGVECAKCDFILNSARLGEDFLNNPAKALKCPKCNWHYRYQETLEVHMKDKHPESTSQCIYCITNQQHPRLARGETYTCGYKPFRCEVCNYSTTTKGNLSIHMQSDKHINNMQELQNGGVVTASDGTKITQSILSKMPMVSQRLNPTQPVQQQQQNFWRCDICNFETNQPRNLRIHMTSEKHIQSITAIQQNMKQLQGLQMLQSLANTEPQRGPMPPQAPEMMMMMDLAHHNQSLFLQMLAARQSGAPTQALEQLMVAAGGEVGEHQEQGNMADPNPSKLFNCVICREFNTDILDALASHIAVDRSMEGEGEVAMQLGNTHICKLCSYKTNLKANFQLHCKTDKHLARLSLYNHIREGGPSNEWKLGMLAGTNPTQIRCHACDFNTNSLHKLQSHVHTQGHEVSVILFTHLAQAEEAASSGAREAGGLTYACSLCRVTARGKAGLMAHARSLTHLRAEQAASASGEQPGIADIFTVTETSDTEQAESSETESQRDRNESSPDKDGSVSRAEMDQACPLCQEPFADRESLEEHASKIHQINREGLQKLASLVEGCHWLHKARTGDQQLKTPSKETEENGKEDPGSEEGCVISEKHVYKYRCSQCSLAFKTQDKLETHSHYHLIRDASKCRLCERNFRSVQALLKHLEASHTECPEDELTQYRLSLMTNPLMLAGMAGQAMDEMLTDSEKMDNSGRKDSGGVKMVENDTITKDQMENIVKQAKKVDKILNYPMEKYLDPNRPFKCDVCKESFTQKNILLVHFNSVSHLHRLKKVMQEQQENNQPSSVLLTPQSDKSDKSPSAASGPGSTLLSVLGSLNAKKQLEMTGEPEEEEAKPFKCNICGVSYSQASNLDIHVRSVLHSSRAAKLQDLVMMGQVDLSKPLIEQPLETEDGQGPHLMSPQSMGSSPPGLVRTPVSPFSSPPPASSSQPRSLMEMFGAEGEDREQTLASLIQSSISSGSELGSSFNLDKSGPLFSSPDGGKKSSHVLKSLLQNYGFELVMQFNESHQRRKLEERLRLAEKEILNSKSDKKPNEDEMETEEPKTKKDEPIIPELKKSNCPICQKEFSSIWVLKAHTEEVHKVVVPQEVVQKYIEELKSNSDQEPASHPPPDNGDNKENDSQGSTKNGPEEGGKEIRKSSEDDTAKKNWQNGEKEPDSRQKTGDVRQSQEEIMQNFMKEALRMMQQQNLNSLSPGNNLLNMNLHPPLLPPGFLPPGPDPFTAFLLQAQHKQQQQAGQVTPFEQQILKKLGIDPEAVKQAGLDPKFLVHLANMDPQALDTSLVTRMMGKSQSAQDHSPSKMMQLGLDKHPAGLFPGLPPPPLPGAGIMSPHHQDPNLFTRNSGHQFVDQNKRARTRITDDQLKILRANFDINNSPSEEQINVLVAQTGLPPKVIKHWYRNTLFKERQRNKDSPYNFNNPPSTVLNIEEYEKTGEQPKVAGDQHEKNEIMSKNKDLIKLEDEDTNEDGEERKHGHKSDIGGPEEGRASAGSSQGQIQNNLLSEPETQSKFEELRRLQMSLGLNVSTGGENSLGASQHQQSAAQFDAAMLSSQMNLLEKHPLLHSPLSGANFPLGPLGPFMAPGPGPSQVFPPQLLNGFGGMRDPSPHPSEHPGLSHSPNSKRANRTRFTDYQIKVLQEFFENNPYPKDDDLEYLSKLLGLSPRVIVVWFQNARQKARKVYENQPSLDPDDEGAGRFTRTPGLNYQCKKCLLVFQRYYELIRHQKQHCFKEEDAKRSAQAQAAAAHAAATFVSQTHVSVTGGSGRSSEPEPGSERSILSPVSLGDIRRSCDSEGENKSNQPALPIHLQRLIEEKKQFGTMFEKFSQEERVMKFINENSVVSGYPLSAQFAMLQRQATGGGGDQGPRGDPGAAGDSDDQSMDSFISSPSSKRKLSDDNDDIIERDENGQPKDKRLRTTILPEQLDYLYQKYQIESNPSRKMLEQFAAEVGLRKRVVQVWFQNTRARERKGQYRAHQQVINKRCPFCPALFKVRSALESHLATKHVAQFSKGDINIDTIPDAATSEPDSGQQPMSGRSTLFPSVPVPTSPPASGLPPTSDKPNDFETSMRKYYEDTMKQFIHDVNKSRSAETPADDPGPGKTESGKSEAALDLSSPPLKPPSVEAEAPGSQADSQIYEFDEDPSLDMENYPSEISSHCDQFSQDPKKRCRTAMSPVQVKLMRHLFLVHKTPSMAECQALAQLIGLPKRVVQVWFQNARSKDKKARLSYQEIQGREYEEKQPEMVKMFGLEKFVNQSELISQVLTSEHMDRVRAALERGEYNPPTPGLLDSGSVVDTAPTSSSVPTPVNSRMDSDYSSPAASHKESYSQPPEYPQQQPRSGYPFPSSTSSASSYPTFSTQSGSSASPAAPGYHSSGYSDQYNHNHSSHYQGYQGHSYQTEYHRYHQSGGGDSGYPGGYVSGHGPPSAGPAYGPGYPCLPQVATHGNHYQMYPAAGK